MVQWYFGDASPTRGAYAGGENLQHIIVNVIQYLTIQQQEIQQILVIYLM